MHSDPGLPLCELSHLSLSVTHALGLQLHLGRQATLNMHRIRTRAGGTTQRLRTCVVTAVASTALSCSTRMLWSLWLFSAARMDWTLLLAVSSN